MLKLILIVVAVVLIYLALTRNKRVGAPPSNKPPENMVRCEVCGVHLPQDESVAAHGRFFCSEAHRNERIAP